MIEPKLKVCIVTSAYPPQKDGVGKYVQNLKKNSESIHIDVITSDAYKSDKEEKDVYRIMGFKKINLINVYKQIKKLNPHVLHVHYTIAGYGIYSLGLLAICILVRKKIILIITYHEIKRDIDKLGVIGSLYYRLFSLIFKKIYVHTNEAEKLLVEKCAVQSEKITVIPLGIQDLTNYNNTNLVKELYKIDKRKVFLYIGFIHVDKGIEYIIKAAIKLYERRPDLKKSTSFIIGGDVRTRSGIFKIFEQKDIKYKKYLQNLVNKNNLHDNVQLAGFIKEENLYALYSLAECIIIPYTNVEQSSVLYTALSIPRPIIATEIGGIKETLNGVGILVPPKNEEKITENILRLLEDHAFKNELTEKYLNLKTQLNINTTVNRMINDYNQLITNG